MPYSVRRDFTLHTKQELEKIVKQVEPADNWWSRTADDIGDLLTQLMLAQQTTFYVANNLRVEDNYHQDVIDANNASKQQIETIWRNVNATASTYFSKFVAADSDLQGLQQQIDAMTAIMSNGTQTGTLDYGSITGSLKTGVNQYLQLSTLLGKVEQSGLKEVTTPGDVMGLLQVMGRTAFDLCPNLEIGDTWELVLGPGLVIAFGLHGASDGGAPATLTIPPEVLKGEKTNLKDLLSPSKSGLNIDKYGIPADTNGWTHEIESDGTVTAHRVHDGTAETYTLKTSGEQATITLATSQAYGTTTVTSDVALTVDPQAQWHDHTPKTAPDTQLNPIAVPDLSALWEHFSVPEFKPVIQPVGGTTLTAATVLTALLALLAGAAIA